MKITCMKKIVILFTVVPMLTGCYFFRDKSTYSERSYTKEHTEKEVVWSNDKKNTEPFTDDYSIPSIDNNLEGQTDSIYPPVFD